MKLLGVALDLAGAEEPLELNLAPGRQGASTRYR
jgi:hypothetical protein